MASVQIKNTATGATPGYWPNYRTARLGPYCDSSGRVWVIAGTTPPAAYYSTDGTNWTVALASGLGSAAGLDSLDSAFDAANDVIYVMNQTSAHALQVFALDCMTQTWSLLAGSGPTVSAAGPTGTQYPAFINRLSTGNFVIVYQGPTGSSMGTAYRQVYRVTLSSAGVWGTPTLFQGRVGTAHSDLLCSVVGASDRIHMIECDSSISTMYHRSLSGTTLDTAAQISPNTIDNTSFYTLYYHASLGTVVVSALNTGSTFRIPLRASSVANPTWNGDTNGVGQDVSGSSPTSFFYNTNNSKLYAFFNDSATGDLYYNSASGTTWALSPTAMDTAASVSGTSGGQWLSSSAVGVLYADGQTNVYVDFVSTGPTAVNLTPTAAAISAATELATAASKLSASAAAISAATGTVAVSQRLSGSAAAVAAAANVVGIAPALVPTAAAVSAATEFATAASKVTATAAAVSAASDAVTALTSFSPSASAVSAATELLTATTKLAAVASAVSAATELITVPQPLIGNAIAISAATALATAAASLAATAAAIAAATGVVQAGIPQLSPTAAAVAAASEAVVVKVALAEAAAAISAALNAVTIPQPFSASAASVGAATAIATAVGRLTTAAAAVSAATNFVVGGAPQLVPTAAAIASANELVTAKTFFTPSASAVSAATELATAASKLSAAAASVSAATETIKYAMRLSPSSAAVASVTDGLRVPAGFIAAANAISESDNFVSLPPSRKGVKHTGALTIETIRGADSKESLRGSLTLPTLKGAASNESLRDADTLVYRRGADSTETLRGADTKNTRNDALLT